LASNSLGRFLWPLRLHSTVLFSPRRFFMIFRRGPPVLFLKAWPFLFPVPSCSLSSRTPGIGFSPSFPSGPARGLLCYGCSHLSDALPPTVFNSFLVLTNSPSSDGCFVFLFRSRTLFFRRFYTSPVPCFFREHYCFHGYVFPENSGAP